jgi:hypothetical protein
MMMYQILSGHVNYARKLAQSKSELTLQEIILLDKVVKGVTLKKLILL